MEVGIVAPGHSISSSHKPDKVPVILEEVTHTEVGVAESRAGTD